MRTKYDMCAASMSVANSLTERPETKKKGRQKCVNAGFPRTLP